jgi:hypothetical protein
MHGCYYLLSQWRIKNEFFEIKHSYNIHDTHVSLQQQSDAWVLFYNLKL